MNLLFPSRFSLISFSSLIIGSSTLKKIFILFFWSFALLNAGDCIQYDLSELLKDRKITYMSLKTNNSCQAVAIWSVSVDNESHIQAAYFDGNAWTVPANDEFISTELDAQFPAIDLNDAGNAIAIWKGSMHARISYFSFDSVSNGWSIPLSIGDARQDADDNNFYHVAINENNHVFAVWPDFDTNSQMSFVLASHSADYINWHSPKKISQNSSQTIKPHFSMNKHGYGIAAWRIATVASDGIGNIEGVLLKRDNNFFSVQISFAQEHLVDFRDPFVSINNQHKALVSWVRDNGNAQRVQAVFIDELFHKTTVANLSPDVAANRIDVQRSHFNDGSKALVVWSLANELDSSTEFVQYAFYDNGWRFPQDNNSNIIGRGYAPHVCLDNTDNGAVLYIATIEDESQEQLALSLFAADTFLWTEPQLFFDIDPDETNNGIFYALSCANNGKDKRASGFIVRRFRGLKEDKAEQPNELPQYVYSILCCNTETPAAPSPPTRLTIQFVLNRFALQAERFVILRWQGSKDNDVFIYHIYRNGIRIATVSPQNPTGEITFEDHNINNVLLSRYDIFAINNIGLLSIPAHVSL